MSGTWGYLYTVVVKVSQEAYDINETTCNCLVQPELSSLQVMEYYSETLRKNWPEITIDLISNSEDGNLEFQIFTMELPEIFLQVLAAPSGSYLVKDEHNIRLTGEIIRIAGA